MPAFSLIRYFVKIRFSGLVKLSKFATMPARRLAFSVCAVNYPNGCKVKGVNALQEMKAFKGLFETAEDKRDCLAELEQQQLKE